MRAATATVSDHHQRPTASEPRVALRPDQEEKLLTLDLSDLVLPKVNDLQVDGLQSSWFSRLLGKR